LPTFHIPLIYALFPRLDERKMNRAGIVGVDAGDAVDRPRLAVNPKVLILERALAVAGTSPSSKDRFRGSYST